VRRCGSTDAAKARVQRVAHFALLLLQSLILVILTVLRAADPADADGDVPDTGRRSRTSRGTA